MTKRDMKEVENVLRILKRTRELIIEDNPYEIRILSDQTVHSATVSQDPDNIVVAVLVYSLGKVIERQNYRRMSGWNDFISFVMNQLDLTIKHLEKNEVSKSRNHLGKIRNYINKVDGDLSSYVRDIFQKANINKAFKIYEHGLSSQQTAKLLGVTLWDMASYIGQSTVHESHFGLTMPVKKRIKIAEDFFK